ncbi:STAS domain-containing protein [Microbacterium sp.]|uniref:STAS domain-containing protein n=1 Tax=Microbacterium sp. TaxID=51671 RepID=UPI003C73A861
MSIETSTEVIGDRATIRMTGRVDREAQAGLDEAWTQAASSSPTDVVLDFAAVEYINSTGIALIVGLLSRARVAGTTLHARGLTPHYRHIFEITRLSDFIAIDESAR